MTNYGGLIKLIHLGTDLLLFLFLLELLCRISKLSFLIPLINGVKHSVYFLAVHVLDLALDGPALALEICYSFPHVEDTLLALRGEVTELTLASRESQQSCWLRGLIAPRDDLCWILEGSVVFVVSHSEGLCNTLQ